VTDSLLLISRQINKKRPRFRELGHILKAQVWISKPINYLNKNAMRAD